MLENWLELIKRLKYFLSFYIQAKRGQVKHIQFLRGFVGCLSLSVGVKYNFFYSNKIKMTNQNYKQKMSFGLRKLVTNNWIVIENLRLKIKESCI